MNPDDPNQNQGGQSQQPVSEPAAGTVPSPGANIGQTAPEEKCVTCGNSASGGTCVACGQGVVTCSCQPAGGESTGGMPGGTPGGEQPTGAPAV